jgi:hypothetical protein
MELVVPRQADTFADSVGVTFTVSTKPADAEIIRAAVDELGVRHLRAFAPTPDSAGFDFIVAAVGTESGLHLVTDPRFDGVLDAVPALIEKIANLESVEGANDFDAYDKDLTPAQDTAALERLRTALDGASRTILLVDGLDSAPNGVGDDSALLDRGNFERPRDTALPGAALDEQKALARRICGDRPLYVTECGYSTLSGGANSVSEAVAARYITRLFLSHFAQGIERTYWDELSDGATPTTAALSQGLIRAPGDRKPAFASLRNLLQITADPGPAFETTPLEVAIGGAAPDLRHLLLQRRSGAWLLALWNEVSSWDAASHSALSPDPVRATVELATVTAYTLYRPLLGAAAVETGRAQSITLSVSDDVSVLALAPAAGP